MTALFSLGLALWCGLTCSSASAGISHVIAKIDSLENPAEISVNRGGHNYAITGGSQLLANDWLKTGPKASVRLVFPDESSLIVAESSSLKVEAKLQGAAMLRMISGSVEAQIQKGPKIGKHKFYIHSDTIAVGVRGTHFVLDASNGSGSVHTLEGAVDCAPNQSALNSGKVQQVRSGQFVGTNGKSLSQVRAFDVKKYLTARRAQHPAAQRISMHARRGFGSITQKGAHKAIKKRAARKRAARKHGRKPTRKKSRKRARKPVKRKAPKRRVDRDDQ